MQPSMFVTIEDRVAELGGRQTPDGKRDEPRVEETTSLVEFIGVEVPDLEMGFDLAGDVVGTGLRKGDAALLRARDDAHLRHDVERLAHVMARDAEAVRKARFRVGLMTRTGSVQEDDGESSGRGFLRPWRLSGMRIAQLLSNNCRQ